MKYVLTLIILSTLLACSKDKRTGTLPSNTISADSTDSVTVEPVDFREKYNGEYKVSYRELNSEILPSCASYPYDKKYDIALIVNVSKTDSVYIYNKNKTYPSLIFKKVSGEAFTVFGIEENGKLYTAGTPFIHSDTSYITLDSINSYCRDDGRCIKVWLKGRKVS